MFNGNFIVKQSKFLLLITILYLKDCSNTQNNPIFDFDFDLISDVLSLTEDLMNLSSSYGSYEIMSKYFLPQYNWVTRNKDVHLNYSQLLKKYGLSDEEQSEENEDAVTYTLLKIPNNANDHGALLLNAILTNTGNWFKPDEKSYLSHPFASDGYEERIGKIQSKDTQEFPFHSEFLNFGRDRLEELETSKIIGVTYLLSGTGTVSYIGYFQENTSPFLSNQQGSKYRSRITLTVVVSVVLWILRLISAFRRIVFKLNKNKYILISEFELDSTQRSILGGPITLLIRTVLYNKPQLVLVMYKSYKANLHYDKEIKLLSLTSAPKESLVKRCLRYIRSLMWKIFNKFQSLKSGSEGSVVLYKTTNKASIANHNINLFYSDCNNFKPTVNKFIYFKMIKLLVYCRDLVTRCDFIQICFSVRSAILYKISMTLKNAIQTLLLVENINYITVVRYLSEKVI